MFVSLLCSFGLAAAQSDGIAEALAGNWTLLSQGPWDAREGLMGVAVGDRMVLTGGRTRFGLGFAGDTFWTTDGKEWTRSPKARWGRRADHFMLGPDKDGCIFLMGGQTFSHFYNDVWKSCDAGDSWQELIPDGAAPWKARAGLAGTMHNGKMYIAGGCYDNVKFDPGAFRQFLGDVWSSENGKDWTLVTDSPGWTARSGGRLVSFKNKLFMVAGEIGFTDSTQLADVWSSDDDGKTWKTAAETPAYSARSGHGVVTYGENMILVAGWPELSDIYVTEDGGNWTLTPGLAWNCNDRSCGKYDFWPLIHQSKLYLFGGSGSSSTFGKLYKDTWALDLPNLTAQPTLI